MSYPGFPSQPDSGQPAYPPPGHSPQPGYSQPAYPPPGYSTRPPKTSTTGAKVLTFIGIASLVLGVAGVVVGAAFIAKLQAITDGSGSGVVGRIDSDQTVTVDLDANKRYAVWIVSSSDSTTYSHDPVVTSPDGRDIDVTPVSSTTTGSTGGTSVTSGWIFSTAEAGDHEISAPDLSSGHLVVTSEDLIIQVGIGVVLLVVGIGIGFCGLVLTLVGAIWWASRKKKARALAGPSYA
ncbi:MAG: hypothetical protein FWH11_14540 [Micrococcales bacterium]|nr:hypothetical protein [Micrococcales bacterium]